MCDRKTRRAITKVQKQGGSISMRICLVLSFHTGSSSLRMGPWLGVIAQACDSSPWGEAEAASAIEPEPAFLSSPPTQTQAHNSSSKALAPWRMTVGSGHQMLCFLKAKDMFYRAQYGEVGWVPWRAHAGPSLPPEVPAVRWF